MAKWKLLANDKLDFKNADKTIAFFEQDLQYAVKYLGYLTSLKQKGFPVPPKYFDIARNDVAESKYNLALVKSKLKK